MSRLHSILILLGVVRVGVAAGAESVARFTNVDRLPGTVLSLTPELMVMKSPVLEKPAPFFVRNLLDLTLSGTFPANKSDHEATVSLTNGDVVRGTLSSVSADAVILDTPFAGRMHFNRLNVKDLSIQAMGDSIYRGPSGMDGWKTSGDKPSWTYANSAFLSTGQGTIGMEDILPDECAIAFDIAWKGDALGFSLVAFSKDVTRVSGTSGYNLSFQRGGVMVRTSKGFIGDGQAQELLENERVRIEFRASRKTGRLCLFINGRANNVWDDADFKKGSFGKGFHFISQGASPVRISRVTISKWNGVTDQEPDPQAAMGMGMGRMGGLRFGMGGIPEPELKPKAKPDEKDGRMELANGDSIKGEPTSIEDGFVTVKTPLGDIRLPVARLRTINLKTEAPESAILRKGDVRAWFPDGSSLVFDLKAVEDGTLKGQSQNFGSASFKMDTISRIDFNIYDPKLEGRHSTANW
jgi:hypothetical protein